MAEPAIPFDQFQRYGTAALAINLARSEGDSFRILEVGAHTHRLLGKLLPGDDITYLDLEVPPEMRERDDVLVGDATELRLPDSSFDVVVSLDVYEHIPREQRELFLYQTTRVARRLSILAAPFHSARVQAAEDQARAYWWHLFGQPYRWLDEHEHQGLPALEPTRKILSALLGNPPGLIGHGDLKLWQAFIKSHFAKEHTPSLQPLVAILDRFYRDQLFARDFAAVDCYRHFLFCSREPDLGPKLAQAVLRKAGDMIPGQIQDDFHLRILELLPAISEEKAQAFREGEAAERHRSHPVQPADQERACLEHLQQQLAVRLGQIALLGRETAEREARITELSRAVEDREQRLEMLGRELAEREGSLQALAAERQALLQSTSWRLTGPWRFTGHQLKRARHLWRLLPRIAGREGGLLPALRKALSIWRLEGRPGFRRRLISLQAGPGSGHRPVHRKEYREWLLRYDALTEAARTAIRERLATFIYRPLISVVMPVYDPKPDWLAAAVESVRNQLYPEWQLCIADDCSTDPAVRALLERYSREDSRIRITFRKTNGHISAASNSALELATGEWIALLDHDDLLSELALFWMAEAINRHPRAELLYSDEDKIDQEGNRFAPYFKCAWNLDLFYSHNLVTHLGVYRTERVRALGGFRLGFEGAQDYDLALRFVEQIDPENIIHVPRILYHWRAHPQSTSLRAEAKPYAMLAGERALNDHLARRGVAGRAEFIGIGYRVRYGLPRQPPLVTIIIPTRNGLELLRRCIASILEKTAYPEFEILIVDNGSDDPATLHYLRKLQAVPRVQVLRDGRPFNFSALNNRAVGRASGEVVALVNNDIEVITPTWLAELVSLSLQPGVGAVGARLWYPDLSLQHGGVILGPGGVAGHAHKGLPRGEYGYAGRAVLQQSFSAVTGACLVVRKQLYQLVGGLDEEHLPIAFNDVDFCLRLKEAGFRTLWTPHAELYHHESASRGYENTPEKHARFTRELRYMQERWGELLLNDPAYSPNLTLEDQDFGLAWPPRTEPVFEPGPREIETPVAPPAGLSRAEKALFKVDLSGVGLEIGPSHNPLAPKSKGYRVHVLDHAPAAELREKYRGHGVDLGRIEEVDFVWRGEPLPDLIGGQECYDYILASHVIEHTPDLLGFLSQCERLLKPGGMLSLVIPDKRFCFDHLSAPSSTGEILDAHQEGRRRPTPGKVWDHYANAARCNGRIAWTPGAGGELALVHSLREAAGQWRSALFLPGYRDVHNWRFTPASFRLLIHDLNALGFIRLRERCFFETEECDFFITLAREAGPFAGRDGERLRLCLTLNAELTGAPGFSGRKTEEAGKPPDPSGCPQPARQLAIRELSGAGLPADDRLVAGSL